MSEEKDDNFAYTIAKNWNPVISFKKSVLLLCIDQIQRNNKFLYCHFLYDFCVQKEVIKPKAEEIKGEFEKAKNNWANKFKDLHEAGKFSEEAFNYNMEILNTNKHDTVINEAKHNVFLIHAKNINFDEVKKMLDSIG